MRARGLIAMAVTVAIVAAACGSSSAGGKTSAPKPPPKTVVLMTYDSFAVSKAVLADFTRETGFKVKVLTTGDAGQLVSAALQARHNPEADALFGIDNTLLTRALDDNIFDRYTAKGLSAVPAKLQLDREHHVTPIDSGEVCVNDDLAWFGSKGHPPAPKSLSDLAKPAYKKLLVIESPLTSSPGLAFMLTTIAAFGNDWTKYWQSLRANGVRVDDSWDAAYDTDFTASGKSGDRPLVVSYATDPAADVVFSGGKKTTPTVGVVQGTCFAQVEFAAVLRGGKNPTGAKALIDFMLTKEYQEGIPLQNYAYPAVCGTKLPSVFTRFAQQPPAYSMDVHTIGAHRNDWLDEWTQAVLH
jgi:thiamine transport system substrate-binding protein